MRRLLTPILARLHRARREASPDRREAARTPDAARARGLCEKLDRAVRLGQLGHAERLAGTAMRLVAEQPRVAERIARLRLMQGRAELALSVVDACRHSSASLRLLRACCLVQVGRVADAHLDLHRWSPDATAPLAARQLLAAIEWSCGDRDAALRTLQRNLRYLEDPDTLALLVTMAVEAELPQLDEWAERLWAITSHRQRHAESALLLESVGIVTTRLSRAPDGSQVAGLAVELAACETVIPALVDAQCRRLDRDSAGLLAGAIEIALPDLAAPAAASESLARLELALGDVEQARDRAAAVLRGNPMSASAALLVRQCNDALHSRGDDQDDVVGTIGSVEQGRAA